MGVRRVTHMRGLVKRIGIEAFERVCVLRFEREADRVKGLSWGHLRIDIHRNAKITRRIKHPARQGVARTTQLNA